MPYDDLAELKAAAKDLLYPSETDAPFDVFRWGPAASARDLLAKHVEPGKRVETVSMANFFGELEGTDNPERFDRLRRVLDSNLTDLQVFRVGAIRIDVYVIGKIRSVPSAGGDDWAGVHTVSVET
jgi:Nuclease A inhibitor-like protein